MNGFDVRALEPSPWKNGTGLTREIVRVPLGAELDAFDWRVSIAEVSGNGAFSTFDGIDRCITLLDGAGFRMQSRDGSVDHELSEPLSPFAFRGEHLIDATLLDGPSRDFSVMTRRATTCVELSTIRARTSLPAGPAGVLYVARGVWRVDDRQRESHILPEGSGLWWDEPTRMLSVAPHGSDAALIAVAIRPRADSL